MELSGQVWERSFGKETLSRGSLLPRLAFRPLATYGNGLFFEERGCRKGSGGLAEPCFTSCLLEAL